MPRIVHFEIPANDPEKAAEFYKDLFGWEISKWEGPVEYWLIKTGESDEPGIDGAFFKPEGPMNAHVNTIEVDDIDSYIEKAEKAGGKLVVEKMAIPGIGYQAYCVDPEGVIFGLHQADKNVK